MQDKDETVIVTFKCPRTLKEKLQQLAKKETRSLNNFILVTLAKVVENEETPTPAIQESVNTQPAYAPSAEKKSILDTLTHEF